jgi:hypothetical protein
MNARPILTAFVLCVLLFFVVSDFLYLAHAQGNEDLMEDLRPEKKETTKTKGATKTQAMIGIGSILVAIAVLKWL